MTAKFLYITPYFPPSAQNGAHRAVGLVRNLPPLGWEPVVLASPPLDANIDEALVEALPPGLSVHRGFAGILRRVIRPIIRSMDRKRRGEMDRAFRPEGLGFGRHTDLPHITPLDQYMWDLDGALRSGARLVAEHRPRAVVASGAPWSSFPVGHWLSRRFSLPLLLDLQDPWAIHPVNIPKRPQLTQYLIESMEWRFFRGASAVVLNTRSCRDAYRSFYRDRLPANRFTYVRNAFDPGLYEDGWDDPEPGFGLHLFGWFRTAEDARMFLSAFAGFVERRKLAGHQAFLTFYADPTPSKQGMVEAHGLAGHVRWRGHLPLGRSQRSLRSASAFLLVEQAERSLQIPEKIYHYLAARRPVLAVCDNREVRSILEEAGAGITVPFGDESAVQAALGALFDTHREDRRIPEEAVEPFCAARQARAFADVLESLGG